MTGSMLLLQAPASRQPGLKIVDHGPDLRHLTPGMASRIPGIGSVHRGPGRRGGVMAPRSTTQAGRRVTASAAGTQARNGTTGNGNTPSVLAGVTAQEPATQPAARRPRRKAASLPEIVVEMYFQKDTASYRRFHADPADVPGGFIIGDIYGPLDTELVPTVTVTWGPATEEE